MKPESIQQKNVGNGSDDNGTGKQKQSPSGFFLSPRGFGQGLTHHRGEKGQNMFAKH